MPFSPQTLDFLFENRLNDSKTWFHEHKQDYEKYVADPLKGFASEVMKRLYEVDEQLVYSRISRIYRDARFAKGKSIFRENMWCVFSRARDLYKSLPAFYFDVSPEGFSYGCGYYYAATETMDAIRSLIIDDSIDFIAALDAYKSQNVFELYGDMYKRNHFPEQNEEKCLWLNRKTIGLSVSSTDWDMLFSDGLACKIAESFKSIAPIYNFFLKAEEIAADKK